MTTPDLSPDSLRKLAERIGSDYCSCLEDYKRRGRIDPQCESCNTADWRHEAAAVIRSLASRDVVRDAERYVWMRDNDATELYCGYVEFRLNGDKTATPEAFSAEIDRRISSTATRETL